MARRSIAVHHAVHDKRRAARSYREIKQQHEESLKEARIRKQLRSARRSKLRLKQERANRRRQQILRRWLFVQAQFVVKKALLERVLKLYRDQQVQRQWLAIHAHLTIKTALLESALQLYAIELEFQKRRQAVRQQKRLFTSRLEQANLEELWAFYRCGRKLPYLNYDEASLRRTQFGLPELSIYLCWERSYVVEGHHYHLGNPSVNSRWSTEKLMIIDEIRKRETQQAV